MPKYFCSICDAFLTFDSEKGRRQHNHGFKHRDCYRTWFAQFLGQEHLLATPGLTAAQLLAPGAERRPPPGAMGPGGGMMMPGQWAPRPMGFFGMPGGAPPQLLGPGGVPPLGAPMRISLSNYWMNSLV